MAVTFLFQSVLYFAIYAFLGWVVECSYVRVGSDHWVNRGFLHGPFIPVYGLGGMMTAFILRRISEHPVLLFLLSFLFLSFLEYVAGWALEHLFKTKWWDYSGKRWNIQGRVCLLNSIFWGILGLVVNYLIHPAITRFIGQLDIRAQTVFASIFLVYFAVDTAVSCRRAVDFRKTMEELERLGEKMHQEMAVAQAFYEKKRHEYETAILKHQEEWRQTISLVRTEFSQGLIKDNEEFQARLESANEHLKNTLNAMNEDFAEIISRHSDTALNFKQKFRQQIHQKLGELEGIRLHRNIAHIFVRFPSLRLSGERPFRSEFWDEIKMTFREKLAVDNVLAAEEGAKTSEAEERK